MACYERRVPCSFFLGGGDLEMVTIAQLLKEFAPHDSVFDRGLTWQAACASAYRDVLRAELDKSRRVVLVELRNDMDLPAVDHGRLWRPGRVIEVDHHGERAGADAPTSLEQVIELIGLDIESLPPQRRRLLQLVSANERGHIRGLRRHSPPASDDEIRQIRNSDLAAQGVTPPLVQAASEAARHAVVQLSGRLTIACCPQHDRTGLIAEFLEPVHGGTGFRNLLVVSRSEFGFFGEGQIVTQLAQLSDQCWYGGSLPESGYWGVKAENLQVDVQRVVADLLGRTETPSR